MELNLDGEGGIELLNGATGRTLAGVDADGQMYLDRAHSGRVEFHHGFAARHRAPRAASSELRVLVDRSSVEWFAGDGEAVISNRVFPAAADDGLQVFGGPGTRRRLLRVATIQ